MGGRALPAALAVVAVGAALLARATGAPAGDGDDATLHPATPVLSIRRLPALVVEVTADTRLRHALDAALADPALGPARDRTCLMVTHDRRIVYSRQPDEPLIPASNMKVLTAAAALAELGSDARLRTEVRGPRPAGGVVAGDLWLVGGGDPLLATADYAASLVRQPQTFTPMEALADRVVAAGVREVRGRVLGDETRHDPERFIPTWKASYRNTFAVTPASALTVNDNFEQFDPAPRRTTSAPATNAAAVLTRLLQARGVVVVGPPGEGTAPTAAAVLATVDSPPLVDVVAQMLRESDNLTAELLVKELAVDEGTRPGTTAAGITVARRALSGMGAPVQDLRTVDGSGLDRSDRATCELLLDVLVKAGPDSRLAQSFPVAGRDGTLYDRFLTSPARGRLQAKTGALDGVTGLTGYASAEREIRLAFSMLANDVPGDAVGRRLQERIGEALIRYPEAPAPEDLGPAAP